MNNREKGAAYERLTAAYLEKMGYLFLEKNYLRKTGEIDLIFLDNDTYVFTEVKYRKTNRKGDPAEAVSKSKQARIYRTAQWYLNEHGLYHVKCRFDVISILDTRITHIKNAFGGF